MTRLLLGLSTLTLLAACGVQGELARPDPLWNREHAIQSECRRERSHHEPLDSRCRQTMTVEPHGTTAPQPAPADTTTTTTTPTTP